MPLNFYELTYIVKVGEDESEIRNTIDKLTRFLTDNEAEIEETDEWGVKNLAYEIDRNRTGFYVNQYFRGPGKTLVALERYLKLDENIIRFLTLKYDNKMLRHRELVKKGGVPEIFPIEIEETED